MRRLLRRLRYLLRPHALDADVLRELDFHRDMIQRDLAAQGLPPEEVAHAAQRRLGGVALAREQVRDVWIAPWLQSAWQDVRFAARLLLKHRSFTIVATIALALGIGVNSTLFAVVNAYCLRGLPIDDAARVLMVTMRDAAGQDARISPAEFEAFRDEVKSLAGTAAFATTTVAMAEEGVAAERVQRTSITANAFALLGRQPLLGRDFRAEDVISGAPAVVILSGGLWQTRYGGDPRIIGRLVRLDGTPATVIGVMPERFTFPNHTDIWQPLVPAARSARTLDVFGRLAAGQTIADARAEIETIATRLAQEAEPEASASRRLRAGVMPINERFNGRITDPAWIAFLTVGFLVVLIACANVANLLLMRSADRAPEMAIRVSLGATSRRIVRQVLIESALLAALGGTVGLGLALLGLRLIIAAIPEQFLPAAGITIDARVLAMLAMVCLGTVFVFGVVPARQLSRIAMPSRSIRTRRWTAAFLTGEVALTMILLAHVSWNARSILQGRQVDAVIDTTHLLTLSITLPQERYRTPDARRAFHDQLQERLQALPSVTAVATTTALPFSGATRRELIVDGRDAASQSKQRAWTLTIGPRYFDVLRLPIVQGRAFVDVDGSPGHERVIVNQRFADLYFHDEPIIGRRIQLRADAAPGGSAPAASAQPWLTIVGVATNLRQRPSLDPDPIAYLPFQLDPPATTALMLRTSADPIALAARIRADVQALDPDLPVDRIASLEDAIGTSRWNTRLSNALVIAIASIALLLSMVGLYTLTAHAVAQRAREIGIRMALGAAPGTIAWLILRRALVQLATGLVAGVVATLLWARVFEAGPRTGTSTQLTDPLTLMPVAIVLVLVAIAACLWPTRRATRNDPVSALRCP